MNRILAVLASTAMLFAVPSFASDKVPLGGGCGGGGCKSARATGVLLNNQWAGGDCGGGGCKSARGGNVLLRNVPTPAGGECGGGGCKSARGGNVLLNNI